MSNSSIWNPILTEVSKQIPSADVDRWLKPLYISEIKNERIELTAPNKFFKTWVEDNYLKLITTVFKEYLSMGNNNVKIDIIVASKNSSENVSKAVPTNTGTTTEEVYSNNVLQLDSNMTFDNFVEGPSNRMAYATCMSVSNQFDKLKNPLYIYGNIGLGKTHLMQAIGNKIRVEFPKLKIIYTTGELYVNEFVNCLKNPKSGDLDKFKMRYNGADVLLFDDVQMLGGDKTKTREEFFNTFNVLTNKDKRIILTSNCIPENLPTEIGSRLTSRFSSGMMVDIGAPSADEKEAILRKRLDMMEFYVRPEITRFLAENTKTSNVRELLGILTRLVTYAQIENDNVVTQEFAEQILKDYLVKRDRALTPNDIIEIVLEYFNLKLSDLKSKTRTKNLVYARSITMFLLREKSTLSLVEIGSLLNRDHSTVMNAIEKIKDGESSDVSLKGTLDNIRDKMKRFTN